MKPLAYSVELTTRSGAGYESFTIEADTASADSLFVAREDKLWRVRALELREALDEPYQLELTMICNDVTLDVDALVGGSLVLTIDSPDLDREVRGIVLQASYLGTFDDTVHVRLRVGPSLALAELVERSRIFQGLSVPEIVQVVAGDHLGPQGAVQLRLDQPRQARDYCVQFRESDLAFIQRLLAEEGIHFFVEQSGPGDTLVVVDAPDKFVGATLDSEPDSPSEVMVATGASEPGTQPSIVTFEWRRAATTARHEVSTFDWLAQASATLASTAEPSEAAPWESGEHYRHAFARIDEIGGVHRDETDRLATLLRQRAQSHSGRGFGHGNALGFCPGTTFTLREHPTHELNRAYLLLSVTHHADCPEADVRGGSTLAGDNYSNRFECLPADGPSRPRPRPKPRIHGHQTATVIGPAHEEIHTDAYGRIQVWMHWDREGRESATSRACWLRVAQPLAGAGFGTTFLPRVGMDVLVSFVDGDPDRPVCVGCLYDGANPPPYALPEDRTKTTIKTRSTPGGDGHNELRFDDAAGSEEVHLHAQRNLDEVVKAAHTMRVGSTQSVSVGADQTLKVGGSRDVTVDGSQNVLIQGKPKPGGRQGLTTHVVGDIQTSATLTSSLYAPNGITFVCGPTSIEMTPGGITLKAGAKAMLRLDSGVVLMTAAGACQLGMSGDGVASLASAKGAAMSVDTNVKLASAAGSSLELNAEATTTAAGGGKLELSGNATLRAAKTVLKGTVGKITLDQSAEISGATATMASPAGTVEAHPAGVKIGGATVDVKGATIVTIAAPVVKVN